MKRQLIDISILLISILIDVYLNVLILQPYFGKQINEMFSVGWVGVILLYIAIYMVVSNIFFKQVLRSK
jgi:hypothetical protein